MTQPSKTFFHIGQLQRRLDQASAALRDAKATNGPLRDAEYNRAREILEQALKDLPPSI